MKYAFTAYPIELNGEDVWLVESIGLKGCAGQGYTVEEAVLELEANEREWLSSMKMTSSKNDRNIG